METAVSPARRTLTIAHSIETGTTISGTEREDAQAIRDLRTSFKWWPKGNHWYRQGSRGAAKPTVSLEVWARRLREAGYEVVVVQAEELTAAESAQRVAEVARDRADTLSARAERKTAEANATYGAARAMLDRIPMGQPIHGVRDRNFRDKMHAKFGKGYEQADYAKTLTSRASAADAKAERLEEEAAAITAGEPTERDTLREWYEAVHKALPRALKKAHGLEFCRGNKGTGMRAWTIIFGRLSETTLPGTPSHMRGVDAHLSATNCEVGPAGRRFETIVCGVGEKPEAFVQRVVESMGRYIAWRQEKRAAEIAAAAAA